ncbi:MAG: sigma-70 family RNA polymerase sigma factor [Xanthomonadales bacterium]|nr:sigma-70 family RNA polymerase sigma factor [Xanthomonadales bacterium]
MQLELQATHASQRGRPPFLDRPVLRFRCRVPTACQRAAALQSLQLRPGGFVVGLPIQDLDASLHFAIERRARVARQLDRTRGALGEHLRGRAACAEFDAARHAAAVVLARVAVAHRQRFLVLGPPCGQCGGLLGVGAAHCRTEHDRHRTHRNRVVAVAGVGDVGARAALGPPPLAAVRALPHLDRAVRTRSAFIEREVERLRIDQARVHQFFEDGRVIARQQLAVADAVGKGRVERTHAADGKGHAGLPVGAPDLARTAGSRPIDVESRRSGIVPRLAPGGFVFAEGSIDADLRSARSGDGAALERLLPVIYEELKRIARGLMRGERANHTLQTTALVHEAWLRMAAQDAPGSSDRLYFFSLAATMMRRILVNHARDRAAQKRGDGVDLVSLSAAEQVAANEFDLLGLHEALEVLARLDARQARVVEMKFFAGLELAEIAELLGVSLATVKRDWTMARLWLSRELSA